GLDPLTRGFELARPHRRLERPRREIHPIEVIFLTSRPRHQDLRNERRKSRLCGPALCVFGNLRAQVAVLIGQPRRETKMCESAGEFERLKWVATPWPAGRAEARMRA